MVFIPRPLDLLKSTQQVGQNVLNAQGLLNANEQIKIQQQKFALLQTQATEKAAIDEANTTFTQAVKLLPTAPQAALNAVKGNSILNNRFPDLKITTKTDNKKVVSFLDKTTNQRRAFTQKVDNNGNVSFVEIPVVPLQETKTAKKATAQQAQTNDQQITDTLLNAKNADGTPRFTPDLVTQVGREGRLNLANSILKEQSAAVGIDQKVTAKKQKDQNKADALTIVQAKRDEIINANTNNGIVDKQKANTEVTSLLPDLIKAGFTTSEAQNLLQLPKDRIVLSTLFNDKTGRNERILINEDSNTRIVLGDVKGKISRQDFVKKFTAQTQGAVITPDQSKVLIEQANIAYDITVLKKNPFANDPIFQQDTISSTDILQLLSEKGFGATFSQDLIKELNNIL